MAGAFSGHLVDSFYANQARFSTPFTSGTPHIITSGAMSFNPQMHGTPSMMGNQSMTDSTFSFNSPQQSFFSSELSEATTLKIAAFQAKLNQKLGPEYISQRPGPGGGPKLTYVEGWKIINLANEVFGFNGWSSNVVSLTTDFIDFNEESRRYTVGTTAIMRVTLRDGVYHEDIGYGMLENSKSKGAALDKCKKEAVTDGLKRALRNFGNLLGNCLYDKSYTHEVVKIKVPPPKFDKSELHRRPEFEDVKPNVASTSASTSAPKLNCTSDAVTPTRLPIQQVQHQSKAPSSVPARMRQETSTSSVSHSNKNPATNITTSSKAQPIMKTEQNTSSTLHNNIPLPPPPERRTSVNVDNTNNGPSRAHTNASIPLPPPPERRPAVNVGNTNSRLSKAPANTSNPRTNPPRSPSPPPIEEPELDQAEESFHFYSDDDAFLALVDLGEGDLGQPFLPETDLGRPIEDGDGDREEARPGGGGGGGDDDNDGSHHHPGRPPSRNSSSSVRAQGSGRPQEQKSTAQTGMLSRLLPQHPQQPRSHRLSDQPQPVSRPAPAQNSSTNIRSSNSSRHVNNPHQNNSSNSVATATSATKKPSVGGFHFPPGVNPLQQQQQAKPPQVSGQGSTSGIGLKRPLDAASSSRRSTINIPPNQVKREILGQLDVEESGDVKRMRR